MNLLDEFWKIIKEKGVLWLWNLVTEASRLILPFVIWFGVYRYFSMHIFNLFYAIIGLVFIAVNYIPSLILIYPSIVREKKLIQRIESNAMRFIKKPSEKADQNRFKMECEQFLIPYITSSYVVRSFIQPTSMEQFKKKIGSWF